MTTTETPRAVTAPAATAAPLAVEDADVEEFGRLLGSMQTVRVRDAGHMIPWDNEEGFYEALGSFLGAAV